MNSFLTWLSQFILEIFAVWVAIELSNFYTKYKEKKNTLILTCSHCECALKLTKLKKQNLQLCYKCLRLYRNQQKALKSQELAEKTSPEG
jgi:uncharacterized paraquat-inducible protein A